MYTVLESGRAGTGRDGPGPGLTFFYVPGLFATAIEFWIVYTLLKLCILVGLKMQKTFSRWNGVVFHRIEVLIPLLKLSL